MDAAESKQIETVHDVLRGLLFVDEITPEMREAMYYVLLRYVQQHGPDHLKEGR